MTGPIENNAISIGLPSGGVLVSTFSIEWFHDNEVLRRSQTKLDFNH
jgi:hypothetical protein